MSFKWDPYSAGRKLASGIGVTVSTPTPVVSVGKTFEVTKPNNPKIDAYRNCVRCGMHLNYHVNGKCPGSNPHKIK